MKGSNGEYLMALDDGLSQETLYTDYAFDYITDDQVSTFDQKFLLDDLHFYLSENGRTVLQSLFNAIHNNNLRMMKPRTMPMTD